MGAGQLVMASQGKLMDRAARRWRVGEAGSVRGRKEKEGVQRGCELHVVTRKRMDGGIQARLFAPSFT